MHSTKYIIEVPKVFNLNFYKFAGAIVVFDSTDPDTFKKMSQWVAELKQYLPADVPIMIAGNKADLNSKAVTDETAQAFARSQGSTYFATSAKSGNNVNEIFQTLAGSKIH